MHLSSMCIHVVLNSVSYIWFYFLNILSFHNLQFYSLTVFFLTSKISLLFWSKNVNTSNSSFHHLELIDGERNTILDSSGIRSFSISSIVFSKAIFTAKNIQKNLNLKPRFCFVVIFKSVSHNIFQLFNT